MDDAGDPLRASVTGGGPASSSGGEIPSRATAAGAADAYVRIIAAYNAAQKARSAAQSQLDGLCARVCAVAGSNGKQRFLYPSPGCREKNTAKIISNACPRKTSLNA